MGGVFYLQECRNPHTNPSLRTSSQKWAIPGLSWVANKVCQTAGPQVFPGSDGVCGRCSGAETDAEENEPLEEVCFPHQDGAGQPSESKAPPRPQRGETSEGSRTCQHHTALSVGSNLHGDPGHNIKISSVTGHPKSTSLTTAKTFPQEPIISQMPLGLQIRVSGQMGGLGISIAGGKGSLPFKSHDEGIFISRVIKGGASEKAGIHVGDRLLEVNGLSLQGATHQEAVGALRKAGGCIKLKVLRERVHPREACDLAGPQHQQDVTEQRVGIQQPKMEGAEDCLSRKTEAVVCNGNDIADLESKLEAEDSLHGRKHTMPIPRIILTHPSTSDEDVELLTQSPSRESPHASDIRDRHVCLDGSFYSP